MYVWYTMYIKVWWDFEVLQSYIYPDDISEISHIEIYMMFIKVWYEGMKYSQVIDQDDISEIYLILRFDVDWCHWCTLLAYRFIDYVLMVNIKFVKN